MRTKPRHTLTVLHQEHRAGSPFFHECCYQRPHGVRGVASVTVIVETGDAPAGDGWHRYRRSAVRWIPRRSAALAERVDRRRYHVENSGHFSHGPLGTVAPVEGKLRVSRERIGEVVLIQTTSGDHHANRRAKALGESRLRAWLQAGGRFSVWSWSLAGPKGKRKRWTCRAEPVRLSDLDTPAPDDNERPR